MNTHIWLVKFLACLVSIVQASALRDRYYAAANRVDLLETAIEDILRISQSGVSAEQRLGLIQRICDNNKRDS